MSSDSPLDAADDLIVEIPAGVPMPSTGRRREVDDRHPDPLQFVLSLLVKVRARSDGRQFWALCPAHDDQKKQSLSVGLGRNGRVLLYCHAGCAEDAITQALGLRKADLYPPGYCPSNDPRPRGSGRKSTPAPSPAHFTDWAALVARLAAGLTEAHRGCLADHLGLPDMVFDRLPIGYLPGDEAYTFPECGADGRYCGVIRRYLITSEKKALPHSTRGLTVPRDWAHLSGPLFCPEGASDTLALTALSLASVGRPNNSGGIDVLKHYLAQHAADRDVVILGEHDRKADGSWPGRTGAMATAQGVANHLGRPVKLAMPPGTYKDVRSWVQAQEPDLWAVADDALLAELRGRFLGLVMPTAQVVEAVSTSTTVQPPLPDAAETHERGMQRISPPTIAPSALPTPAETRRREIQAMADVMHTPGRYVAYALDEILTAVDVIQQAGLRRSLVIVPTHRDGERVISLLGRASRDAKAYPPIDGKTCWKWESGTGLLDVRAAQSAGMPVAATICTTCPHSQPGNLCPFQDRRLAAERADHLVVTESRAALDPEAYAGDRDAVLLLGVNPMAVLKPLRSTLLGTEDDSPTEDGWASKGLRLLDEAAREIEDDLEQFGIQQAEPNFWPQVRTLAGDADRAVREGKIVSLPMPARSGKVAYDWARALWAVYSEQRARPRAEITRLLMAAACGRLTALVVGPYGDLTGIWPLARFPESAAVLALGGHPTGCLTSATGDTWQRVGEYDTRCPPDGVTQIARRITTYTSPRQLAGILRLHIARHSGRVGVAGHRRLLAGLWSELDAEIKARVARYEWFAGDPESFQGCESVLCFGLPRLPPQAIYRELLRRADPAASAEPEWGIREFWEGTDATGNRILVRGCVYGHERWQEVDQEMTMSVLRRLLGRVTCPVVIVSDARLGVPLEGREQAVLTATDERVLDALTRELQSLAARPNEQPTARTAGVTAAMLAAQDGCSKRTAQLRLASMEESGLVVRVGTRGGWLPGRVPPPEELAGLPDGHKRLLEGLRALTQIALPGPAINSVTTQDHNPQGYGNENVDVLARTLDAAPVSATATRLAELTGLANRAVRRSLERLHRLGIGQRVGRHRPTRWTLTTVAVPEAAVDQETTAAFEEVHVRSHGSAPATGAEVQLNLPYRTAALAARLAAGDEGSPRATAST